MMVKGLKFSERRRYRLILQKHISRDLEGSLLVDMSECIDASAEDRAESYGQAMNLWQEGQ